MSLPVSESAESRKTAQCLSHNSAASHSAPFRLPASSLRCCVRQSCGVECGSRGVAGGGRGAARRRALRA
eukprot:1571279-Rhodomonas_salina.1